MPKLEPLVKNATQKISDPEARGVAEKAYKTLQKAAGEGAQSLQQVTAEAAKKQVGPGFDFFSAKSLVKIVLNKHGIYLKHLEHILMEHFFFQHVPGIVDISSNLPQLHIFHTYIK